MVEYLDPEIANEGESANSWVPGAWTNAPMNPGQDEEYQPDIEPPHINDYAAFKKHKHYRQYFRPYKFIPYPAWMYHPTLPPKIVKNRDEVVALGREWRETPFQLKIDMTGKSLPVKSETQRLAETVAAALASKQGAPAVDATSIAAIVAAVMAAMNPQPANPLPQPDPDKLMPTDTEGLRSFLQNPTSEEERTVADGRIERTALLELAEKEGVKVDGRWSNERIKKELGL